MSSSPATSGTSAGPGRPWTQPLWLGRAVALVAAVTLLVYPLVTDDRYYQNMIILSLVFAVGASGLNIISGFAGYISLGQSATELSGGEAQRVKLASELRRAPRGDTLYLLDEPTSGLHPADSDRLIGHLQRLVDGGNTVIVVEHDMRVVAEADWVIDLGPDGGKAGGQVVASAPPEAVVVLGTHTGRALAPVLARTA